MIDFRFIPFYYYEIIRITVDDGGEVETYEKDMGDIWEAYFQNFSNLIQLKLIKCENNIKRLITETLFPEIYEAYQYGGEC